MFLAQKLFCCFAAMLLANCTVAQESQLSPEIQQMYRHGQEYLSARNFRDAIITFRQAILLVPDNVLLYKELGRALYLSGKYSEAERTLSGVLENAKADAACYQLVAASQAAEKKIKKAQKTLNAGLERFPAAGLLYHEAGNVHYAGRRPEAALNAWLDGIQKDPGYAPDYYKAALVYLGTDRVLWGLLYGEMYLNMEPDTTGTQELKQKMFAGYKTLFNSFADGTLPGYRKTMKPAADKQFEGEVLTIYASLTPVVSDGVTAENLTMARTRFLMDWFPVNSNDLRFSLFVYLDEMVRHGYFEIYNEWLFGKAEHIAQFNAWDEFHEGDIKRFLTWRKEHPFRPGAGDFYNNRDMKGLFKNE